MALHRKCRAGLALAFALGLTACGGGGSAGSDPMVRVPEDSQDLNIGTSNYEAAGQASVANVFIPGGIGDAGVLSPVVAAPWLLRLSLDLTRSALRSPGAPLALLLGFGLRQTLPCSEGGSMVVGIGDTNNNGRFDDGDGLTLDAQSCKENGTVLQGRISFAVQSLSGVVDSSSYGATLTVTLSAFTATRGADTVRGDGTLTFTQSQTLAGVSELKLASDFMMFSGRTDGQPFTVTLSGVKLTVRTETVNGVVRTSVSYDGQISSSGLGGKRVIVSTPQPLVITGSDRYPSSGQLMVRGNASSALRITPVNAAQARLEVDAEGDGRYEAQTQKNWTELK